MIYGIGCDVCSISRIENTKDGFCERFFTEKEQYLFDKKPNKWETVAANFAAKEAFGKALGTGVSGFGLLDIEVLREENGKPYINLYDNAKKIVENLGIKNIFVTLAHDGGVAMACVVLER